MSQLKRSIPSVEVLDQRLCEVMDDGLANFITLTHNRRRLVQGNARFVILAIVFLLAISAFLFSAGIQLGAESLFFKGVVMLAILWTAVLFIFGRGWFSNTKLLAREMNMALAPIFSNLFERNFMYTHHSDGTSNLTAILEKSSLLTNDGLTVQADDSYHIYGEQEVVVYELLVTAAKEQWLSREPQQAEAFRGLLVVTTLSKTYAGETYLSTEGDRTGFAHRDFWTDLIEHGTVQETQFEWNEFEEKLHVATSDPAAAREIFTPELMQSVYQWWEQHQLNIRIAFKGNQFYLLVPESSIKIETSTTSVKLPVLKKYALSLARPIWRSLCLIEDVSK